MKRLRIRYGRFRSWVSSPHLKSPDEREYYYQRLYTDGIRWLQYPSQSETITAEEWERVREVFA